MDTQKNEPLFKHIASTYLDQYGEALEQELAGLEQSKVQYLTPRLDRKVKSIPGSKSRRYALRSAAAIAACFVIAMLLPVQFRQKAGDTSSMAEVPAAEEGYDAGQWMEGPEIADALPPVIPLSFELPPGITLTHAEQDQGKSIYYLEREDQDDIVLTLEYLPAGPVWEGLVPVGLNGETAYAASNADFQFLVFEKDDLLYTMTCCYDVNTLLEMGRHIL